MEQENGISDFLSFTPLPFPAPVRPVHRPDTYIFGSLWSTYSSSILIRWGASAYTAGHAGFINFSLSRNPRFLPLTHSRCNICRAEILGTAPAIINVLNRCSKMTKRIISAAEENAEVKQEQR